jgi:hypothetical protein
MKVASNEINRHKTDPNNTGVNAPNVGISDKSGSGVSDCKTKRWLTKDQAKLLARQAERERQKATAAGDKARAIKYDVKAKVEAIRKKVINLERKHFDRLNGIRVMVRDPATEENKEKGLGTVMEAQQIVDQLHLTMMDDNPDNPLLGHGLMEMNMGGHPVNKKVLRECIGQATSGDVIVDFVVMAPDDDGEHPAERYTWSCDPKPPKPVPKGDNDKGYDGRVKKWEDKWGNATDPEIYDNGEIENAGQCADGSPRRATGRVMYIYAVTAEGKQVRIAKKNMRTKTGDLGNYDTVVVYSEEMQDCFEKKEKEQEGK